MDDEYAIYVPAAHATHHVRPGSAIVGALEHGMVVTHYEGGTAENVRRFEDRLNLAAGRRRERYPTSAMRGWRPDDVVEVGRARYDHALRHWLVAEVTDRDAFAGWLGDEPVPAVGGSDELLTECGSRMFSGLPERERSRLMSLGLPATALCAEVVASARRGVI